MRISYESVTDCLGPGKRYVIWTQGCEKRCPGCINPEGRDPSGGYEKSVPELIGSIAAAGDITGVTVSGGEPFLRYEELRELDSGAAYRGSDNQRIFFFTDKYRDMRDTVMASKARKFSFDVAGSGEVYLIGIPPKGAYEKNLEELGGN